MSEEHAKISPSAFYRIMACPGSLRMCEKAPDTSSCYAQEGTAAHFVAEWALKARCDARHLKSILRQVKQYREAYHQYLEYEKEWINAEMLDHIQGYLDVVRKDMKSIPAREMVFAVEEKFSLEWLADDVWGTNDCMSGRPFGLLRIYDLKYGAGIVVEPAHNSQLMIYALGALGENNTHDFFEVELVIYQPRADHPEGPCRRWRISVDDLYQWSREEMLPAIRAALDPEAPLKVGEWCHFCRALPVCPEMSKSAYDLARAQFGAPAETINLPEPELLFEDEIAKVLQFSALLSAWSKEVAAHARHILESGGKIPGYKLVAKKSNRKWMDAENTAGFLGPTFGHKIYEPRKLLSPARMEKLVGPENTEKIRHLWHKPDAGHTIAPESDRRKAVAPSALTDFL